MNSIKKHKKALLNISGLISYIGSPLIPAFCYFDFFTKTNAKTSISAIFMLIFIIGLGAFKYIFKKEKLPFDFGIIWLLIAVSFTALKPIMDQMIVIAWAGVGGHTAGSFMFKKASNIKDKEEKEKMVKNVAKSLKEDIK